MTHEEIYQRYLYAGALTRDADALAELFAPDGVVESPLVPEGHEYPRRLEGREQIRAGMAAYYQRAVAGRAAAGGSEVAGEHGVAGADLSRPGGADHAVAGLLLADDRGLGPADPG